MAKKRVNLYMEEALMADLDAQSKHEGRTKTEIVRRSLEEYFKNHPRPLGQDEWQARLDALR